MTNPTNSALHMMEGQAMQTPLIDLLARVPRDARLVIDDGPYSTHYIPVGRLCAEARDVILAAPKTALSHFADEVEASGEAEKHAYPPLPEPTAFLICKGSEVTARAWNVDQMRAYVDADRAAMRYELHKFKTLYQLSQDGFARERGITKELAAALKGLMDLECRDRIMPIGKEWDAARAALSKVQS